MEMWWKLVIWFPYIQKNKQIIENIQRRGTRLIPELKGLSYTQRLQKLKLFSLDYRRKRGNMIQLFKILNNIEDMNPESMFKFSTSVTRGHNKKLYKPQCNKVFRQHSFCICTIDPWNKLSQKTVDSKTVKEFKTCLDSEWKHNWYNVDVVY